MNLVRERALPNGLYHFIVVARVLLDEEIHESEVVAPAQGYYRSYGVTAQNVTEAVRLVEDELWKYQPAGGRDDPRGSLEELEASLMDPDDVGYEGDTWRTQPGIHWVSGRVYFTDPEEEEDDA